MDGKANLGPADNVRAGRRPPSEATSIFVAHRGGAEFGDESTSGPVDLTLEATNADGELAEWLDDIWWTDAFRRWMSNAVVVHIAPTLGALLHPVILYQLEMIRRVAPNWRLVGHAYTCAAQTNEAIVQMAGSPYHEVRFKDHPRPGTPVYERRELALSIEKIFGMTRREQARLGATRPILVRIPSGEPPAMRTYAPKAEAKPGVTTS